MEKKHSEKEKTSLDSPSPKLNKSMIAYHEEWGIIELVYIVLQSVVKPGITGFFKIDLHIKCYIYLSWFDRNLPRDSLFGFVWK